MDSSSAHAIVKLKTILHRLYQIEVSIFCSGNDRDGFPCQFNLAEALSPSSSNDNRSQSESNDYQVYAPPGTSNLSTRGSISIDLGPRKASEILATRLDGRVCQTLDDALMIAEDILIARCDPSHSFHSYSCKSDCETSVNMSETEERYRTKAYLRALFTSSDDEAFLDSSAEMIISMMVREDYKKGDIIWDQGLKSTSMKIVVSGELLSLVDETGISEVVTIGNIIGDLGLVHGTDRLTTLACASPTAVLYSLDLKSWEILRKDHPNIASLVDGIVIRYLAHRVQHVSNRYFNHTLPI